MTDPSSQMAALMLDGAIRLIKYIGVTQIVFNVHLHCLGWLGAACPCLESAAAAGEETP